MRALAIALFAGCFDPKLAEHLHCAEPDNWCPPPQSCGSDGFCGGAGGGHDDAAGSGDGGLPDVNLVFTSSEPIRPGSMVNADIVTMADAKCQALGAKLRAGTYIAWLGESPGIAGARLPMTGGWARSDGRPFAISELSLSASNQEFYPPRLDDDGADVVAIRMDTPVLTQLPAADGCAGTDNTVIIGRSDAIAPSWLDDSTSQCQQDLFLYCFETDKSPSAVVAPTAGPDQLLAFVTNAAYPLVGGIDAVDGQCQTAAEAAGIGSHTFRAFVAPTGASAQSRFAGSTKPWVRRDGVVVANPDLSTFIAPLSIDENGKAINVNVAFGATSPTAAGIDTTNCTSWTAASTVTFGDSVRSSAKAFSAVGPSGCGGGGRLYCLEVP